MELAAYSIAALTLALVVIRPRIGARFRVTPAVAAFGGVAAMLVLGLVSGAQFERALADLWSPFVAIAAIMVMTEVARRVGLLDVWAGRIETHARSTEHLFGLVFGLGVLASAALNNDAAILLLTPLVVALVRRRYPDRPRLIIPFAFAVFTSAGVAALPVSNPMNMVVAEVSGIGFNTYAVHMLPVAIACWLLSYWILRWIFRDQLREETLVGPSAASTDRVEPPPASTPTQRRMMLLLTVVLLAYPVVGLLGGPVWAVASAGALLSLVLFRHALDGRTVRVVYEGVSWDTLAFLLAVLILALGLSEVGMVGRLAALYEDAGVWVVGITSACGSSLLNNHPMAYLNMLALDRAGAPDVDVLAALVGGDLGPRLLPMGSLAGLLWLELLRRSGVHIRLRQFVVVGLIVTVPTLVVALAILSVLSP